MAGTLLQCGLSEFLGTFLLLSTVLLIINSGNAAWGAAAIASILMVSIYSFGPVSGGHFNPAVTFAVALRKIGEDGLLQRSAIYIGCQILGALAAVALFSFGFEIHPGLHVSEGKTIGACLCEVLYTFMLCFVVLNTAVSKRNKDNQFFGIAIGYVIIAGGTCSGFFGAGNFNPAVSIALLASGGMVGTVSCVLFIVAQILGAAIAAVLFGIVRPEESKSDAAAEYGLLPRLTSEAIGTFMLVVTVGLNVLASYGGAAFSIGMALSCMIFALGDVSGGHFNPAVTVAILASGKSPLSVTEGGYYIGAQIVGGILGAFTYALVHGGATFPLGPGEGHGWLGVATVEILFTFVLTSVVLGIALLEQNNVGQFGGFIVGSCVIVGGFAAGGVSGGSLNPAVSLGISTSHILGGGLFWKGLVYSVFELIGAGLASAVFRTVHERDEKALLNDK
jgi:aquaporin Z